MPRFVAHVDSRDPARLLRWLCNHWRHKFEIGSDREGHARIPFGDGRVAEFEVEGGRLHAIIDVPTAADAHAMQGVVASHLQRFAREETLVFDWQPG